MAIARPLPLLATLVVVLVALAALRPIDHDESQYVAAAVLTADGLMPYRDYAFLQTPLQPFAFAPLAWLFGGWAWGALRIANALLGAVVVAASWRAMREAGVGSHTATLCAGLLATCDILLFSAGTARNDALPAALLAVALAPMLRAERVGGSRAGAVLIGLLLGGAAAAKISYALPAATYGVYALVVRRHRPWWVLLGALPPAALVAWTAAIAPAGFLFGTLHFPAAAPAQYYEAAGRAWKLSAWAKALDTLKFLVLGPALLAIATVALRRARRWPSLLEWLVLAGLVAALLPAPTWRQYLLPALPPLFVLLAERLCKPARAWRIAAIVFAVAGLAPTIVALAKPGSLVTAMRERAALAGVRGPVATLAPQFVAMPDPRFAPGPFHFRSRGLLTPAEEVSLNLVSRDTLDAAFARTPPAAIMVGGEAAWTSGDPALDSILQDWAIRNGWRRAPLASDRLRLYLPPQAAARALPSISER